METWHQLEFQEVVHALDSDDRRGLSSEQHGTRLREIGPNELVESAGRTPWQILWEQLNGPMVRLLIVAVGVSVFLDEYTDAIVILAIVVINAALGFVQDYRAERALAALRKLSVPVVRVKRNGIVSEISARDLVPGDVVFLEVGNYVPADGRLFEAVNLQIDESALTGESTTIAKGVSAIDIPDPPLGDRTNMVYMGTIVTNGHGQVVITETGMRTQLGQIASSLQTVESEPTPLQRRLAQLGKSLVVAAILIVAVVFVLGLLRGEDPELMIMTALSLAVAVVPEGLPAVATVALAIGARRMFRHQALIRKLPAVETLGSVDVICSDKTGTLTENRMTVQILDVAGQRLDLRKSDLSSTAIELQSDPTNDPGSQESAMALLLLGAALCNDAELVESRPSEFHAVGDPTESALCIVAASSGYRKDELAQTFPRIDELPFDSDRKRMTTVHRIQFVNEPNRIPTLARLDALMSRSADQVIALTKGAVDSILEVCCEVWRDGQSQPMDDGDRQRIEQANAELASQGMRVLGLAVRWLSDASSREQQKFETDLVFVGLVGMIDPPRTEAAQAVARCRTAGIRPIMITGDHPLTAKHIAAELNVSDGDAQTGQDLKLLSEADLKSVVEVTSVFARVAPKHKLQLVQALQDNGHVVAMTGDGVNDAPALKQAHIGVAMGITGTDVSKEASQMVLLDDNFATIVNAVEQGRIVYDNIRKFVKYTMTSNAGEVWVMVLGSAVGMPVPLLPLQILWVNLVTDGLPGIALAVEQAERDTMQRAPYARDEPIFDRAMIRDIAWIGLLMGIVSLILGFWHWQPGSTDHAHWRTLVFTTLTFAQMGNAMAIRSNRESIFQIGVFSNPFLVGSVALTLLMQLAVIYWPPLQHLFQTESLTFGELGVCLLLSTVVFWAVELQKWFLGKTSSAGR